MSVIQERYAVLHLRPISYAIEKNGTWKIMVPSMITGAEPQCINSGVRRHYTEESAWIDAWKKLEKEERVSTADLINRVGEMIKQSTSESLKTIQHGGKHYKGLAIQPAEYCHKNHFDFCESEAIKYLSHFRNKNGAIDVKKAIHFAQMILDMEYGIQAEIKYSDDVEEEQNDVKS